MSESRKQRRRDAQKKEQARIWGGFAGIAVALVPSIVPRLPVVIVAVLLVLWLASWPMARDGYRYHLALKWAGALMLAHGALIAGLGYWMWPRISVTPAQVSFGGYPNETFNFSIQNGRAEDVYDVQVPFFIGRDKHFEDKLSAKIIGNVEPLGPLRNDYNYCYGVKGDGVVSHVQKSEQEVLIVRIPHLIPYGSGTFSITYAGGEKLPTIVPGKPSFIAEPYSYSPNSGTAAVRGDYRICKFVLSPSDK